MNATDLSDLPQPGAIVADKYTVVGLLGRGGMGVVLEAYHQRLNQRVALKLLLPSIRSMTEVTARFEREARAIARLQGPHIARILDVDALPDGSPFMVMELLRGKELGVELAERRKLPVREAVGYILQACAAMAEAHRMGIVHRDIKPSNLFLCEREGYRTVKVLDFGISKLTGDVQAAMTTTASAFGTPLYMSPEQVRSVKDVDARADIWSLGVVLYELLSGELPFDHPSATAILASIIADRPVPITKRCPDLPRGLADAIMRALQKDPAARFADVREFAATIAPYGPARDHPSQVAVTAELLGVKGLGSSRRRRIIAASVALAVAASGALIFFITSARDPAPVLPIPDPTLRDQPISTTAPTVEPAPTTDPSAAPSVRVAPTAPIQPIAPRPKSSGEPTVAPVAPVRPTASPASTDDPKYL